MALLAACHCGAVQTGSAAPTPGNDTCIMPLVATCLNTDAGIVSCENQADTNCGLASGTSAQVWAGVEQVEVLQGFLPKGH